MENVKIFDTTLRDGDQAAGYHMTRSEKQRFARQLINQRVDIIEAGFAASPGDAETIRTIAQDIGKENVTLCSLARAVAGDIQVAARALEPADNPRIHTFIATSPQHMQYKLKKSPEEVIDIAYHAVLLAKEYVDDVEFSCEDFSRSDPVFVQKIVDAVVDAGATTINLPDTVGFLLPYKSYDLVSKIYVPKGVTKSVHNHNDLGLATANTIEGIRAGARQFEGTILGIGERAGNASIEEVVMALRVHGLYQTNVRAEEFARSAQLLRHITRVPIDRKKAIVGANAFNHEAGIHVDGMQKNQKTYEIIEPSHVGMTSNLSFGPRSGWNAYKKELQRLGFNATDESLARYNEICVNKKFIDDADLAATVSENVLVPRYRFYDAVTSKDGVDLWVHSDSGMQRLRGKEKTIEASVLSALKMSGQVTIELVQGEEWRAFVRVIDDICVASEYSHQMPSCAIAGALVDCYNRQLYVRDVKAHRNQPALEEALS